MFYNLNRYPYYPIMLPGIELSRQSSLVTHSGLHLSHSLLPYYYFFLSLNSSLFCNFHYKEFAYNLHNILFIYPSLFYRRNLLLSQLHYLGYFSSYISLLHNFHSPRVIHALVSFIINAGFLI